MPKYVLIPIIKLATFHFAELAQLLAYPPEGITSPYSQIAFMQFHGAASRIGASETAFALREEHYEFFLQAGWEDDGQDRHVQWARQSYQTIERFASQRGYVNFLADEGAARVRAATVLTTSDSLRSRPNMIRRMYST